jgi:hypothetical protein
MGEKGRVDGHTEGASGVEIVVPDLAAEFQQLFKE